MSMMSLYNRGQQHAASSSNVRNHNKNILLLLHSKLYKLSAYIPIKCKSSLSPFPVSLLNLCLHGMKIGIQTLSVAATVSVIFLDTLKPAWHGPQFADNKFKYII